MNTCIGARHVSTFLVVAILLLVRAPTGSAEEKTVVNDGQLVDAINGAQEGDVITLLPGVYSVGNALMCSAAGTAEAPIVVRAGALGTVIIEVDTWIGFRVGGPHWTFENLEIEGVCASHDVCEHAFQVVGLADFTTVRSCKLRDFNAAIKGNGDTVGPGGAMTWPDGVLIEFNEIYNSSVRQTGNPVTPIGVVGGHDWVVRANFIHDHAKAMSDQVSFAAFFKGNSKGGLMERNLVICELLHSGQIRLGLSFGGGGSSPPSICEESNCSVEHDGGVMRNNIIVNCPADVGIYLNEAKDSKIYNNTIYNTAGIDVRFPASNADVRNNLLDGEIRARDGATVVKGSNLEEISQGSLAMWFANPGGADFTLLEGAALVDQGETLADIPDDFCANWRDDGLNDIGAVEYDEESMCPTTQPYYGYPEPVSQPEPEPEPLPEFVGVEMITTDIVEQIEVIEEVFSPDLGAEVVENPADTVTVYETIEPAAEVQPGQDTPVGAPDMPLDQASDLAGTCLDCEGGEEKKGGGCSQGVPTQDAGWLLLALLLVAARFSRRFLPLHR